MSNSIAPYSPDAEDNKVLALIGDLRNIIECARGNVAATANYELTMMYWHIGERINRDLLDYERASYGERIVATLSRQLQNDYGSKGFEEKNLRRMLQFARLFPDEQIVATLSRHLWWSHFVLVLPLKDVLQESFISPSLPTNIGA